MLLLILHACTDSPKPADDGAFTVDVPPLTEPPTGTEAGARPEIVVPLAEQDVLFTAESPYTFYSVWDEVFADVDGDGFTDALMDLVAPHDAKVTGSLQVIVRGPLEPGTSVPSDAWLSHDTLETYVRPAELTGDGVLDFVVHLDGYGTGVDLTNTWIVPGPYGGTLTPAPSWIAFDPTWWDSWWFDVDLDGTRDLLVDTTLRDPYDVAQLHITWGPIARWGSAPDVIVSPLCRDSEIYGYGAYVDARFPGDIDGDGTPEVTVEPFGLYEGISCGWFTVSLPAAGFIDPFTSTSAYEGVLIQGWADGDWTDDGLPEMRVNDDLLLSPITLSDDGPNASATIDATSDWESFEGLEIDLGADGVPDAIGVLNGALVVFPADPAQLESPTIPKGWELRTFDRITTFLDQGHAWAAVLEPDSGVVRRIDLGPAAPL